MKNRWKWAAAVIKTVAGCALFAFGFNMFLEPNGLNAGGISGLSMVFVHFTRIGSIGIVTAILNLPLFAAAGMKIGKRFFLQSLIGMALSAVFLDTFALIPIPQTEPLVGALYGGVLCGVGLGIVFAAGGSTGGSDIIVRLLKLRWKNVPIGTISICFDLIVALLTGIVFQDISRTLYSGVAIFVSGLVVDAVVYRFDYSKVALIVTQKYDAVAARIGNELGRGATLLHAEGCYTHQETKVVLTAVKRQQLADLKQLVVETDPDAFIIVQEAHQVLGDGFRTYSKDAL